jgi:hypothetical protein
MEQCTAKALKNLQFCGRHSKAKNPRLWHKIHATDKPAILIQKIWRGWMARYLLKLAGPGVLKRSMCHNEEDLVTCEEKTKQSPEDYFGFLEGGKVYWFDICSMNQWIRTSTTNPYTRQPLAINDRIRLREICRMRRKMYLASLHQSDHSLSSKWLEICQIIEENGFFDMNHQFFQNLGRSALHDFMIIVLQDLIAYADKHSKTSRRQFYVEWVKNRIEHFRKTQLTTLTFSEKVANTLLLILYDCVNNYDVCFIIVSARCRL